MSYRYQATERFWHNFYGLSPAQKDSARRAWQIFKQDPFDPRLGTHKINRLSAIMRRTVYAVVVEGVCAWSSMWKATRLFRSTSAPTRFTRRDARQIERATQPRSLVQRAIA